jgi:peptidoglycan/xylan/chitin deacetylase (PgdA/CDA1 family)
MEIRGLFSGSLDYLRFLDAYGLVRRKTTHSQIAILAYHRVCPERDGWFAQTVRLSEFEKQIKYLSRSGCIVHLDELASLIMAGKPLPEKAAVLTLDDGHQDNYAYAYPILKKYGAPATIFLTTGYIGTGKLFPWDEVNYALQNTTLGKIEIEGLGIYRLRSVDDRRRAARAVWSKVTKIPEETKTRLIKRLVDVSGVRIPAGLGKERVLDWNEIEEMSLNNIAFGAHTVNHPILTNVSPEQARVEIVQSKRDIEERLNRPVTTFSFPNGNYNAGLVEILRESGFTCAVTASMGMVTPEARPYELPRAAPGWTLHTLKVSLSGLYPDLMAVSGRVRGIQH